MDSREIVVGTDGSACATAAVRWSAREAALRAVPLHILLAHDTEWPGTRFGGEPGLRKLSPEQADSILETAADTARGVDGGIDLRPRRVVGWAVPTPSIRPSSGSCPAPWTPGGRSSPTSTCGP
ncbi:universal stress protein [Asanoa sp. NPDC049518]|uniref:universal stress protein n=1 Tax=unclassified Asanoa TaxID=2685164 RepID=UPI00342740BD